MIATPSTITIMAQKNAEPAEKVSGEHLARIRKERGFTQTELADAIGVSQGVISYYEQATRRSPVERLPKIAAGRGVTTDMLLGVEPLPKDGGEKHRMRSSSEYLDSQSEDLHAAARKPRTRY